MQKLNNRSKGIPLAASATDPRWAALNAVREARQRLGIKDRTIAVLRGLLTLVPLEAWTGNPMVHASNAMLQERCDGMDERTLRRHLATLVELGLLIRHQSPNKKRYVVRNEAGAPVLTYGFDLSPLREAVPALIALAEEHNAELVQIRALKAVLRDRLYHLEHDCPDAPEHVIIEYRRLLRRDCSVQSLENAIALLKQRLPKISSALQQTRILSDSDGQNDRHIQSSNKEHIERRTSETHMPTGTPPSRVELSVADCTKLAPNALEFALTKPETWPELIGLADQLGPGLGISHSVLEKSRVVLGEKGRAIAVLGLTQAYPQIRQPDRYLNALLTKANSGILNLKRMFQSLTSTQRHHRFPAGNHTYVTAIA
ncbi:plasmid replication protein RepC [Paracoccus litorisediminis]|uniref:plasmid replication protein RepC n=1 Tax=Paracoccus litorisediminis TaxID=2006130 RepID=UPI00373260D6